MKKKKKKKKRIKSLTAHLLLFSLIILATFHTIFASFYFANFNISMISKLCMLEFGSGSSTNIVAIFPRLLKIFSSAVFEENDEVLS